MFLLLHLAVGLTALQALRAVAAQQDYCQLAACPAGSHTACKFKPGAPPSEACSKDANGLLASDKNDIVDLHNQLRQQLARGELDGFSSALDMESISWDAELEAIAQVWADQCAYGHDDCRDVQRFKVGQNIATTGASNGFQSDLKKKVMMWWDEYKDYPYKDGSFVFQSGTGHFTQMAWAKTNLIGCGRSSFVKGGFTNEYLVCNYGPSGNVLGQKIYTASANRLSHQLALTLFSGLLIIIMVT